MSLNMMIGYAFLLVSFMLLVEFLFFCFGIHVRKFFVCKRVGLSLRDVRNTDLRMIRASDRFVHCFVFFVASFFEFAATLDGVVITNMMDIVWYFIFTFLLVTSFVLIVSGYYHCMVNDGGKVRFVSLIPWVAVDCDARLCSTDMPEKVLGGITIGKIYLSGKGYVVSFDVSGVCKEG